ncbi:MAG: hypothetical protein IPG96_09460 [Proteobacteria bacterium]|nr:hypothetical protein [Pseudomonadota bacterium]
MQRLIVTSAGRGSRTRSRRQLAALVGVLASAALLGNAAAAEDPKTRYVPDKPVITVPLTQEGWVGDLSLGSSVALSQSSNVVGRIDGTSFAVGLKVNGALDWTRDVHEWRNSLTLGETFTRTPAVDQFVKTNDQLLLESIYLYHLRRLPWLGPFARFKLTTALFPGEDVRAAPVSYVGAVTRTADTLRLTDALTPTTLQEMLGVFGKPLDRKDLALELKAGFEARQMIADGQLALADDAATPEVEVVALQHVVQGGPSLGLIAKGQLSEGRVLYAGLAEAMIPAINNQASGDDRSTLELTNVNLELNLSFKLVSWASVDYQLRAVREPQLIDKWQLQNNLLLSFSYALIERPAPPATKPAS